MKKTLLALVVCQVFAASAFAAETSSVPNDNVVVIGNINAVENPSPVETRSTTVNGQFLESQAIGYGNDLVNRKIQHMTRGKDRQAG
ncbi:hypothetical protein HSX37_16770|uniref:Uncharacterized protein n=1 Tax=Dendrosporobacter quercicolus TaxID=146817 RepID=A0A1G9XEM4_9FIRM|nr:hypothetical protein [Dendrosporobacter quercicolus]NSL49686.1 hypothetical protein [Dendrosporobacter quercicolus DSM 1736]SDM95259.1 hypothetical protein SAMN04488502_10978 [Dendrosporobacter quercicolus]